MNTVPVKEDPSLGELLRIIDRRRVVFLGTIAAVFGIAILVCVFMTRKYEATGLFEVEQSSASSLDLQSLIGGSSSGEGLASSTSVDIDLQTQAQILESDTLAIQVIKDLKLQDNKDFKPSMNPLTWALGLLSPKGPADPAGASIEDSPVLRSRLVGTFSKELKVKVQTGTRLIEVSFTNSDPKVAAAVVNRLIQALIDYSFQTKFNATNQVSTWLEGQLGDLRKQSEELQAKVVGLQQGSGIFGAGGTDLAGKPVVYSPVLDRLQAATTEMSQAEMNRILKGSIYEVVNTGNPEAISQLAGTSLGGGSGAMSNSLALIQTLRGQEATLMSQIGQDASTYGPTYPKLVQERAALKSVDTSLRQEIDRIRERAKNDFTVAQATEAGARKTYEDAKKQAEVLNDKTIEYSILSKEADQSQTLYQDLLRRLKEAGILEGLHSSNVTMVDVARVPSRPSRPRVLLYLMIGLAVGVFLAVCVALLVNAIDNKVHGADEIEAMNIPLVSILPQFKISDVVQNPILSDSKYSTFSEAVRALRSSLLISRSGEPPKVLLITSGSPAEGKSTVSVNLAASFGQYNKRVLLLEGDMRRPALARRLKVSAKGGLSVLLSDQSASFEPVALEGKQNLDLIPAGPTPPYPSELLGSNQMRLLIDRWRDMYDFIIIDSPPVLPVTDAQILAQFADAILLVVRAGSTSRLAVKRSYNLLYPHVKDPSNPNVGVVLNSISVRSAAYYGYYGYYGGQRYEYRQREEGENE